MNKNITKTFKIIFIIFLATTPAGSKENQVGDEVQFCKKNMQSLLAIPFNYTPTELDYNKNFENVCYRLVKSNQPAWYDFRNCLNKAYEQKFESALYLLPQESKSIVQKVRNQTSFSGSQESKFEQYTHLLVQINRKHRVISDINFNLSEWLENCQNPEVAKLGSRKWCRDELMRELNVSQEKIETLTMPLAKVHFCEVDSFRKYQKILIYCAQNKIRE
ncbi:MAG: hypothetical protein KDD40_01920 [Bdellovibrionales bacterium]|nr:hypothetical protein [Bdellovibrionales bacterium]